MVPLKIILCIWAMLNIHNPRWCSYITSQQYIESYQPSKLPYFKKLSVNEGSCRRLNKTIAIYATPKSGKNRFNYRVDQSYVGKEVYSLNWRLVLSTQGKTPSHLPKSYYRKRSKRPPMNDWKLLWRLTEESGSKWRLPKTLWWHTYTHIDIKWPKYFTIVGGYDTICCNVKLFELEIKLKQ